MHNILYLSALSSAFRLATAWGGVGHRTVAYLAKTYFTSEASDLVTGLLANDKGWDISDAAVWADIVKHHRPGTGQWHYIDALDSPPSSCDVIYERDCGEDGCIVSALANQTSLLLDDSIDFTLQKEAMMYVIHFIGDLHQPLHVEDIDRGGNGIHVCFDQRCGRENLHGIWDSDIVHKLNGLAYRETHDREKSAAKEWADSLHNSSLSLTNECHDLVDTEGCAMQWATETNKWICDYVLKDGWEWITHNDLGGSYYEGAAPIVTSQIANAGLRLGGWINAIAATRVELGISTPSKEVLTENLEL